MRKVGQQGQVKEHKRKNISESLRKNIWNIIKNISRSVLVAACYKGHHVLFTGLGRPLGTELFSTEDAAAAFLPPLHLAIV